MAAQILVSPPLPLRGDRASVSFTNVALAFAPRDAILAVLSRERPHLLCGLLLEACDAAGRSRLFEIVTVDVGNSATLIVFDGGVTWARVEPFSCPSISNSASPSEAAVASLSRSGAGGGGGGRVPRTLSARGLRAGAARLEAARRHVQAAEMKVGGCEQAGGNYIFRVLHPGII